MKKGKWEDTGKSVFVIQYQSQRNRMMWYDEVLRPHYDSIEEAIDNAPEGDGFNRRIVERRERQRRVWL